MLAVLGSRLALVEVRAHGEGSVLLLKLTSAHGDSMPCYMSTADTTHNDCAAFWQVDGSNLTYAIKALRKDGDRVLLSIKSGVAPLGPGGYGPDTESSLPETQSWFTPGEALSMPGTGELKIAMTGEWADHIPVTLGNDQLLDPGPNEIRLTSPLILKNDKVAGKFFNSGANESEAGQCVYVYIPGEGRFLLSLTQVEGAVPAKAELNRVSFESDGQKYIIVTGMPVSRTEAMWVRHDAAYKPPPDSAQLPIIGAGPLSSFR